MDRDRARERLAEERARIESALRAVGQRGANDELSDDDDEIGDHATDLAQGELEEGLDEDLRSTLAAIDRAEQRLANGTYGVSIESGEPIPDGRLEAVPWAELTIEEESRRQ
jgi:DnaK suppressor protein